MDKIDNKIVYDLFCNKDLLNYLNINEKEELTSTYLDKFIIGFKDRNLSQEEVFTLTAEYLENIINRYSPYLSTLYCSGYDNNFAEIFAKEFTNLNSLVFDCITITKKNFISIINNLPHLNSLTLWNIMLAYSKNEEQLDRLKFSRKLRNLEWMYCYQFECDVEGPININYHRKSLPLNRFEFMDVLLDTITSLKSLTWHNIDEKGTELLSTLLANNKNLSKLSAPLQTLNAQTFKNISNNINLKRLLLLYAEDEIRLTKDQLINLPHIKSIEIQFSYGEFIDALAPLIQSCENLEELKYFAFPRCEVNLLNHITTLTKLKILSINTSRYFPRFLSSILPESNIEHLEIRSYYPITINFDIFINWKKLKCIKNTLLIEILEDLEYSSSSEDFKDWRMFKYSDSIQYWRK
ncbi:hypothetical protein CONCODRAFT_17236 [Conidiobolus coronatus NRRL 28638]|uniref:RNI-like protein n=1 Tax=Conidiobolus coronatus (strain ATCC 28846 / CBS 209.66 / NRRL 28638) TaxID=796925 RepID=A0A137P7J2_CONC2|nr:hypothetical protein CONCODRAFT_17236 [Conidiobolus coronatus NRRL 28638]|eukprot:KXN70968.1 hypothetical protein CONCODRAFT_17236 [Conidiobolus coronatus NRRL 28638]